MKRDELIELARKAKDEIDDHIDAFIAAVDARTEDPEDFITMHEYEELRKITDLSNHKSVTTLASDTLEIIDTKELNDSKKGSSSSPESD